MFAAPTRAQSTKAVARRGVVERTKDFDFTDADKNDPAVYNRVLWEGTKGDKPYPAGRSGLDVRRDRDAIMQRRYRQIC
jgi:hypothetical protein